MRDLERTVNSSRAEKEDLTRDLCEVRIQMRRIGGDYWLIYEQCVVE